MAICMAVNRIKRINSLPRSCLGSNESCDVIQKVALSGKHVNSGDTISSLFCSCLSEATDRQTDTVDVNGLKHHLES
jgi:hypothetical protein